MTMQAQTPAQDNDIDTQRLGEEAASTGARMGKARLGGQEGVGTLQVVRGRNQEILEIKGTWRSDDDGAQDDGALAQLCDAAQQGSSVRYQGPLVDPDGDREKASVDVEFTSTNRYTFMGDDDEKGGPERRIFNFTPVDGEAALRG